MSPRSLLIIPFLAMVCLLAAGDSVAATQLSWYGDGAHLGGGGTWNTSF